MRHAAAELRFVPSALARGLKSNRTHTIGMMIPNNANPYVAEIIRGIEDTCLAAGFNVVLCNSDDELIETLRAAPLPQVVVDREIGDLQADLVEVNHEAGGYLATRHLPGLGHPRIACIAGLRIPQDLSVIGFDDIALAAFSNPPLTTIAQPKHQTGELATRLLMSRIASPGLALRREIPEPALCVRRSTAALAGAAR